MKIIAKPHIVDVTYRVLFAEPTFETFLENKKKDWAKHIIRTYSLRLNDIIFDNNSLSDKYIKFSKFFGQTFFVANIGLEEMEIRVNRVQSMGQLKGLLEGIFPLVSHELIAGQRFSINQHLTLDMDVKEYLNSLNPKSPSKLKEYIDNKGVFYTLNISEHDMTIQVTLVISLAGDDMLFLNIDGAFSDKKKYDSKTAFKISRECYDIITDAVNLKVENEE